MGERGNRYGDYPPGEIPGERGPERDTRARTAEVATKTGQDVAKTRKKKATRKSTRKK